MPGAYLWGWDAAAEAWVKCLVNADGKLIINPTGFLENPPTEDEAEKAPTSEWAFDHDADASAHHVKYTDAEARASIDDIFNSSGVMTRYINTNYRYFENLNKFSIKWDAGSTHYCDVKSIDNSPDVAFRGREIGVGYPNTRLRLWNGTGYSYAIRDDTFQAALALYLEETPTNGVVNKAPTSNWAYDHDADASAHHAKYTDAEAVMAYYNRTVELTTGTYTDYDVTDLSYISLSTSGGNIDIKGWANGIYGQMIFFSRLTSANTITIYHNDASATEKIYTTTSANVVVSSYSTFYMIYIGGVWICSVIT